MNRSCPDGKNNKGISIGEILRKQPIYKEFVLINQQGDLLSNGKQTKISSIKSLHSERLKLQFMCEDDKYEQDKLQQWNQFLLDQQETASDMTDELHVNIRMILNRFLCAMFQENSDEEEDHKKMNKTINLDSDSLVDRYHSTQKINRNGDGNQYSSDEDNQPPSPYSPDHLGHDPDDEDEDDF